ncbi:hypothetical protein EJ357_20910 [Streptomyces cyaneochromogenes]|uniref:Uncharacterized protein n=1 Tax=Streptomyces cyaneochromogenes TaxID=2496836 RepID=A0A3S9M900_9ACTN|nr:hypothetical protein EJ357_20910 [Streptomyces cyaneochromogenes]
MGPRPEAPLFSPPPPLPVPSLGAAAPRPPLRPEGPRPQTPDGLKLPGPASMGDGSLGAGGGWGRRPPRVGGGSGRSSLVLKRRTGWNAGTGVRR